MEGKVSGWWGFWRAGGYEGGYCYWNGFGDGLSVEIKGRVSYLG